MDSAQRMQRIVHDVLDFAKPIRLISKEEDIRNTLKCACDCCKTKAEEKGVILSLDIPSEIINSVIDSSHIERALINLINNAIDASTKGQNVLISAIAERDCIVIIIKDNGSGMDRETLENIFIPFYTKKSSGTGLGMAIVKKIIEGHKGKIHVVSRPNIITEVKIEIPIVLDFATHKSVYHTNQKGSI